MDKKVVDAARREGGLHLAIENEDWVAITGAPAELEQLGKLLTEFARAEGRDVAIFDSPSPLFCNGSLGICLYRRIEPGLAAGPAARGR